MARTALAEFPTEHVDQAAMALQTMETWIPDLQTAVDHAVSVDELMAIREALKPFVVDLLALQDAAARICRFHEQQLLQSWSCRDADGNLSGQQVTALERVGVYVPGGKAAYPSSVLMNIIPARVAGVTLDLASGGMGLASTSNADFKVWADSADDEPTLVIWTGHHIFGWS